MKKFFIRDIEIRRSNDEFVDIFFIPSHFSKIIGVFAFGDVGNSKMKMNIAGVEYLGAEYNLALMAFNEYTGYERIMHPLSINNTDSEVLIQLKPNFPEPAVYPKHIRLYFVSE